MYQIIIQRQAKKKLESLGSKERLKIVDKISLLGHDPESKSLDIKPLVGFNLSIL